MAAMIQHWELDPPEVTLRICGVRGNCPLKHGGAWPFWFNELHRADAQRWGANGPEARARFVQRMMQMGSKMLETLRKSGGWLVTGDTLNAENAWLLEGWVFHEELANGDPN